jgi:ribosome-associated translation inhibitor RaiA
MMSKEGTVNIYAAIDIVEAKLRAQLRSYKDKHTNEPRRARMLSRWLGRKSEPTPEPEATE